MTLVCMSAVSIDSCEESVFMFTALSQTCELQSSKAAFTIAIFAAVNHNYDHKQWTLKHRNTQNGLKFTNHKLWPFKPIKVHVKLCFLRGPLRWLTAAKNAIISWLLDFRIRMFVKSAVIYYIIFYMVLNEYMYLSLSFSIYSEKW